MRTEMVKENKRQLNLEELEGINGGYIVKDSEGYHVIDDKQGYVIYTFQEDQYDFMMMLIQKKWKISEEYITWEQVEEIKKKNQEDFYNQHPEYRPE